VRIALVTEYYYPHLGGVTEHVHNLALELERQGHPTIVVTANMGPPARSTDPHDLVDPPFVRRIGTSRTIFSAGSFARITTGTSLRRDLRALFQRERIDVVHVHGGLNPTLGLVGPVAAHELGIPVVATFHSWFADSALLRIFRRPLQRRLDRHAAVMAVSQPVIDAHARYLEANWEIVPNGVDTRFFRADHRPQRPRGCPELLFLGRLDPRNGLDTVLAAMGRVLEERPGAHLTVAGDGPLRPVYERLARPLGRSVSFVGRVNGDRPAYYGRADLYLCPTTKASFGITLLESMACGTPIVCSDLNGFRNVVAHDREAMLVRCGDTAALADSLAELLDDEAKRARLGAVGRQRALRYGWPRVSDMILGLYARILGAHRIAA